MVAKVWVHTTDEAQLQFEEMIRREIKSIAGVSLPVGAFCRNRAGSYTNAVMQRRWEDTLEKIRSGCDNHLQLEPAES